MLLCLGLLLFVVSLCVCLTWCVSFVVFNVLPFLLCSSLLVFVVCLCVLPCVMSYVACVFVYFVLFVWFVVVVFYFVFVLRWLFSCRFSYCVYLLVLVIVGGPFSCWCFLCWLCCLCLNCFVLLSVCVFVFRVCLFSFGGGVLFWCC